MWGGRKALAFWLVLVLFTGVVQFALAADSATTFGRYLILLKEQPDPSQAARITNINDRRVALYQNARDVAQRTQAGLISFLQQQQAAGAVKEIRSLQLVNAVACLCQKQVADQIAARPEVKSVSVDEIVKIPADQLADRTPLWNIENVRVRPVWDQGFSGAGIVIGNIDTGVDAAHPAIRGKYRGDVALGNHDYSWYDAIDRTPSPRDDNGHGTHTLGTTVGGEGPAPEGAGIAPDIGLAYGAKWVAARAFDAKGEGLTSSVLLAMQWMQFPTDARGIPDPTKAPDIVSNSWSTDGGCRAWYALALKMWRIANIFPVFSVGDNPGGGSNSPNSPADLSDAFAVGSTDADGTKAASSKEGTACDSPSTNKPDIHAPGVGIYSSVLGATYASKTGTSMAAPHVAGAAALMLESAGGRGSISVQDKTLDAAIKSNSQICTTSTTCRPRLDVYRAVQAVRNTGVLRVTVQNSTGVPIAGAKVKVHEVGQSVALTGTTDAAGTYTVMRAQGDYVITATAYGYIRSSASATVAPNMTTNVILTLSTAPTRQVDGTVTLPVSGLPAAGVKVTIADTPLVTTTSSDGRYVFPAVPDPSVPDLASPGPNDYDYVISFRGDPCTAYQEQRVIIRDSGSNTFNAALALQRDSAGLYSCYHVPLSWRGGTTPLPLTGDDVYAAVQLPFAFPFYERSRIDPAASNDVKAYTMAYVSDNGFISFEQQNGEYFNVPLPNSYVANGAVYAFWDDLRMDASSRILTSSTSETYTVEWRDLTFHFPSEGRVTFSATLHRNGDIEFQYKTIAGSQGTGNAATIGIENPKGTIGLTYSNNEPVVRDGLDIVFSPAAQPGDIVGMVSGTDGSILSGASVRAVDANNIGRSMLTDADGRYRMRLQAGAYTLTASKFHYTSQTKTATVFNLQTTTVDFLLTYRPGYRVSGVVRDVGGSPLANVPITLGDPDIPVTLSDATGSFSFTDVPPATYTLATAGSGRCRPNVSKSITVTGDTTDFLEMTSRTDAAGYRCEDFAPGGWIAADVPLGLIGDSASKEASIGFIFPFYGTEATKAYVAVDGYVSFLSGSSVPNNSTLPNPANPNLAIYPFWDDLAMETDSGVYTRSGSDFFVIEWRKVAFAFDRTKRVTFELILFDNGNFDVQFLDASSVQAMGSSATLGIEDSAGTVALQYSNDEVAVGAGKMIRYISPAFPPGTPGGGGGGGGGGDNTGVVGTVFEEITGNPVPAADVVVGNGSVTATASTDSAGGYGVLLPPGDYTLYASKNGYFPKTDSVTVPSTGFVQKDIVLRALGKHTISGKVLDQFGGPIAKFEFDIRTSDSRVIPIKADDQGNYSVTLDDGDYDIVVWGSGRCQTPTTTRVTLIDNLAHNVLVTLRSDSFGYVCMERNLTPVYGVTPIPMVPGGTPMILPFDFPIYRYRARTAWILSNGTIKFDKGIDAGGPVAGPTGPTIQVFDDADVVIDLGSAQVYMANPDVDTVVFEWRNVYLSGSGERISFEAVLQRNGDIHFQYQPGNSARARGSQAKVAISCGPLSFVYLQRNETSLPLRPGLGVYFGKRFESTGSTDC